MAREIRLLFSSHPGRSDSEGSEHIPLVSTVPGCRPSHMTHTGFCNSSAHEKHQAPWAEEEKFEPVVEAEEEKQVEPLAPSVTDQRCNDGCGGDVDDTDEYRWHPPFQAVPLPQFVQENIRGGIAVQQIPGADAEVPESWDEHQGSHFRGHSGSRIVRALCL